MNKSITIKPKNKIKIGERKNLKEGGALGPDTTVVANDGRNGDMVAIDIAHQMIINTSLP